MAVMYMKEIFLVNITFTEYLFTSFINNTKYNRKDKLYRFDENEKKIVPIKLFDIVIYKNSDVTLKNNKY